MKVRVVNWAGAALIFTVIVTIVSVTTQVRPPRLSVCADVLPDNCTNTNGAVVHVKSAYVTTIVPARPVGDAPIVTVNVIRWSLELLVIATVGLVPNIVEVDGTTLADTTVVPWSDLRRLASKSPPDGVAVVPTVNPDWK